MNVPACRVLSFLPHRLLWVLLLKTSCGFVLHVSRHVGGSDRTTSPGTVAYKMEWHLSGSYHFPYTTTRLVFCSAIVGQDSFSWASGVWGAPLPFSLIFHIPFYQSRLPPSIFICTLPHYHCSGPGRLGSFCRPLLPFTGHMGYHLPPGSPRACDRFPTSNSLGTFLPVSALLDFLGSFLLTPRHIHRTGGFRHTSHRTTHAGSIKSQDQDRIPHILQGLPMHTLGQPLSPLPYTSLGSSPGFSSTWVWDILQGSRLGFPVGWNLQFPRFYLDSAIPAWVGLTYHRTGGSRHLQLEPHRHYL